MLSERQIALGDTNMALFDSEIERKVRQHTGDTENAFGSAGTTEGLHAWRVDNFRLVPVAARDVGVFYTGDSYLVLRTRKQGNTLKHDIHFWLGLETTQDEAGTAAYKAVELDDHLGTAPTQHREVQNNESQLFLSYFPTFAVLRGEKSQTGFFHVKSQSNHSNQALSAIPIRLFHIFSVSRGEHAHGSTLYIQQVAVDASSITEDDVFVLDLGTEVLQYNGSASSGSERMRAAQFVRTIDDDEARGGNCVVTVVDGSSDTTGKQRLLSYLNDKTGTRPKGKGVGNNVKAVMSKWKVSV